MCIGDGFLEQEMKDSLRDAFIIGILGLGSMVIGVHFLYLAGYHGLMKGKMRVMDWRGRVIGHRSRIESRTVGLIVSMIAVGAIVMGVMLLRALWIR